MCGVAGLIYCNTHRQVEAPILEQMCAAIHHRGPDDIGTLVDGPVGLGMTRLSIIDISGGKQPIHNEDKTVWIVFNGEIYNYRDLREELLKKGHKFYTSSDTEVIVHLYEEYGEDCVNHLRGMFAFAIWDKLKEQLFIARDRLGIKPMHYYFDSKQFIFGSEIKSILNCSDVPRELSSPALVQYLAYKYVPDPDTMFRGILKLPPGHLLIYRKGHLDVRQYWEIKYRVEKQQSEEFYIERLLEILHEAVKLRLMSEVPLGAFLSGGLDSSMVVAMMARQLSEPVKTFSIGFEDQSYNELPHARMIAKVFGTDHHEEIVKPEAGSLLADLVHQYDEPFADSSAIPTYYVSKVAKSRVTVALSGDGGDELFGGYSRYMQGPIVKVADFIPRSLRRSIFLNLTRLLPEWAPGITILRHLACDEDERYVRIMSGGLSTIHKQIFSEEFCNQVFTTDPSAAIERYFEVVKGEDFLTRRLYADTKTYLPADILTKVDRASMQTSLEVRVPILDHHLVEFAATIPSELKIKGVTTKYIFKKAAERILPKQIIHRPKQGFSMPVKEWVSKDWLEMAKELVISDNVKSRGIFNQKFLDRIFSEHQWGRRNHSEIIWALMIFELWYRKMID